MNALETEPVHPEYKVARVLLTEDQIKKRVRELGETLAARYDGKRPILVSLLKGGVIFMSDLTRAMKIPHELDFMMVRSYEGTSSTGTVRILEDLHQDIDGRHVILVEDIIDSGLTLSYLRQHLDLRNPASLSVCCLLDKKDARDENVEVDIELIGFSIGTEFVVGYGLDYNELYRNLPFLAVIEPE